MREIRGLDHVCKNAVVHNKGATLKRFPLAILALITGVAACQDVATAPLSRTDLELRSLRLSNPPPPPIDTGASGSVSVEIATTRQVDPFGIRTAVLQSFKEPGIRSAVDPHFDPHPTTVLSFTVRVIYLFNPEGLNGYLHFKSDEATDIKSDPSAMVKYHDGQFNGKGLVTVGTEFGPLVIDLSSVNDAGSSFEGCAENIPSLLSAAAARPDSFCFEVQFNNVTLDGNPVGPVSMNPGCFPRPENFFCNEPEL